MLEDINDVKQKYEEICSVEKSKDDIIQVCGS